MKSDQGALVDNERHSNGVDKPEEERFWPPLGAPFDITMTSEYHFISL